MDQGERGVGATGRSPLRERSTRVAVDSRLRGNDGWGGGNDGGGGGNDE